MTKTQFKSINRKLAEITKTKEKITDLRDPLKDQIRALGETRDYETAFEELFGSEKDTLGKSTFQDLLNARYEPQAKLECWRCKRTSAADNMFPGPICESCSDACWDEEPEVEYEDHGRD